MKFKWHTWMEGSRKNGKVSMFYNENDEYPFAIAYMGNASASITIEAVSGLLKKRTNRCETCLGPGSHNLYRGPVDELKMFSGHKWIGDKNDPTNLKFNYFDIEDLAIVICLYLDVDVGEYPK